MSFVQIMADEDTIGVIRPHPRIKEQGQRSRLNADGCRVVMVLGTKPKQYARDELERLVRVGTVVKVVHLFLLAEPRARSKPGGWRGDLLKTMGRIEKRGGVIKDVHTGMTTADPEHRYAMVALAVEQLARNGRSIGLQGAKRGRIRRIFTPAEMKQAQDAWESRKLKTWHDVREKLPKGFSLARAYKLWGKRT